MFVDFGILVSDLEIQFDIFSYDAVLMAVNHDNLHWTTASINFRRKRFESYDSLFGYDNEVLPVSCSSHPTQQFFENSA